MQRRILSVGCFCESHVITSGNFKTCETGHSLKFLKLAPFICIASNAMVGDVHEVMNL